MFASFVRIRNKIVMFGRHLIFIIKFIQEIMTPDFQGISCFLFMCTYFLLIGPLHPKAPNVRGLGRLFWFQKAQRQHNLLCLVSLLLLLLFIYFASHHDLLNWRPQQFRAGVHSVYVAVVQLITKEQLLILCLDA